MSLGHVGVKHPLRLAFSEADGEGRDLIFSARAANGDEISIWASRERWRDLFVAAQGGVGPSREEIARSMFIRDEISVKDFEAQVR